MSWETWKMARFVKRSMKRSPGDWETGTSERYERNRWATNKKLGLDVAISGLGQAVINGEELGFGHSSGVARRAVARLILTKLKLKQTTLERPVDIQEYKTGTWQK